MRLDAASPRQVTVGLECSCLGVTNTGEMQRRTTVTATLPQGQAKKAGAGPRTDTYERSRVVFDVRANSVGRTYRVKDGHRPDVTSVSEQWCHDRKITRNAVTSPSGRKLRHDETRGSSGMTSATVITVSGSFSRSAQPRAMGRIALDAGLSSTQTTTP